MDLYKNCSTKLYSTLASYLLYFRKNLLERILKLIMAIDDKIVDEKLQYIIKREAAKISVFSFEKIDKHEYITSEEILPSVQRRVIEQAKFTYSL